MNIWNPCKSTNLNNFLFGEKCFQENKLGCRTVYLFPKLISILLRINNNDFTLFLFNLSKLPPIFINRILFVLLMTYDVNLFFIQQSSLYLFVY